MPNRTIWATGLLLVAGIGRLGAAQPEYLNPLRLSVDQHGLTAQVELAGTGQLAIVDLKLGKVVHKATIPDYNRPTSLVGYYEFKSRTGVPINYRSPQHNARGIVESADKRELYVVHQLAKSHLPITQVPQGWVFSNAFSVEPNPSRLGGYASVGWKTVLLDNVHASLADPSAIVVSPNGTTLFIAGGGVDTVIAVANQKVQDDIAGSGIYGVIGDLTTSRKFILARIPTGANPRHLAISKDGKTLIASNYLDDSITVIDAEKLKVTKTIPLGGPKPDAARRGEILFNSAKHTVKQQFSCASCHPDGHADRLNWDLPRDGIGNFKNTKSLRGVAQTAPYGWLGSSETLEDRIQGTLRTVHGYEPSEAEVSDLAAYLKTLSVPEPIGKQDRAAITRGVQVFKTKGKCATCHRGPTYQDGQAHDIGSGSFPGEDFLDTPSLLGVSHSAPFLHHGRASTLEEIFTKHNPKKLHGDAHEFSEKELADLVEFLRSL